MLTTSLGSGCGLDPHSSRAGKEFLYYATCVLDTYKVFLKWAFQKAKGLLAQVQKLRNIPTPCLIGCPHCRYCDQRPTSRVLGPNLRRCSFRTPACGCSILACACVVQMLSSKPASHDSANSEESLTIPPLLSRPATAPTPASAVVSKA